MRNLRAWALAALVAGLALIALAVLRGEARVGLFLVVPFVVGEGPLPFLGFLLLMAAMALWFLGSVQPSPARTWAPPAEGEPEEARRARHGGVVLIGPIPIVWGSDRRMLPWLVGAGLLLMAAAFLLTRAMR